MMGLLFTFASPTTVERLCESCHRPLFAHRVNGRWLSCDELIARDVDAVDRRRRLARLRSRVATVKPWSVDVA